jgi:hypothetical protein
MRTISYSEHSDICRLRQFNESVEYDTLKYWCYAEHLFTSYEDVRIYSFMIYLDPKIL